MCTLQIDTIQRLVIEMKNMLLDASAGTGKTSRLIERTLQAYLSVDTPDQVLDLTFTNKAAAEMRQRLITELRNAESDAPVHSPHEKSMRDLAKRVLKRDSELGWNILKNPNQLEIKTFDSLCASIVSQAPLTSKIGGAAQVAENPTPLYKVAADELLRDYKQNREWSCDVQRLLRHVNNNFESASGLLVELLGSRDQWLPIVLQAKSTDARRNLLEANNLKLINVIFSPFIELCRDAESEIGQLVIFAWGNADEKLKDALRPVYEQRVLPAEIKGESDLSVYKALLQFFVSSSGQPSFYKTLNKAKGFPAPSSIKDPDMKESAVAHKALAGEVLDHFRSADISMWLSAIGKITDFKYSQQEWELLDSLISLLPVLASKLLLVFKRFGKVDFIQMAASANAALGEVGQPTSLAMWLYHKFRHILVDEFQDCNLSQVEFLAKLTTAWEEGDGRSIFLVGDKKQSIYLFRGSNVSLFTLVALNGINDLKFEVHRLENNYRSQSGLVDWVNKVFEPAFGNSESLVVGATAFYPSVARKAPLESEPVEIELFDKNGGLVTEATYVCDQIHTIQQSDPDASIAVLARTRSDLDQIIVAMNEQKVGHRAVDIHKLHKLPAIIDLTVLTRAISHLADRTAWVGLLRSPFVGMSISELEETLKNEKGFVRPSDLIFDLIQNETSIAKLNKATQDRIKKLLRVVNQSIEHLDRKPLSNIIKGAYYELNGLSTLQSATELKNVEEFLKMLSKFDKTGFDLESFESELSRLYAADQKSTGSVSLMTIHKAKGLEFDYVFVPGAHKAIRSDIAKLIDTDTVLSDSGFPTPVIAPSPEAGIKAPQMNSVIRSFSRVKKSLEAIRTAYVGLTRAKKKMYVTGLADSNKEEVQFVPTSILGIIGSYIPNNKKIRAGGETTHEDTNPKRNVISNVVSTPLPENDSMASYRGLIHVSNEILPEFDWSRDINRTVGIVVHQALEDMAMCGIDSYFENDIVRLRSKFDAQFKQLGLNSRLIHKAMLKLETHLKNLERDETLYWLFQKRLTTETEVSFVLKEAGKRKQKRIDLTFKENGTRYIFDFKTSAPDNGETTKNYVARMLAEHELKMRQYLQCFPNEKNVRGALYLTSCNMLAWYDTKSLAA